MKTLYILLFTVIYTTACTKGSDEPNVNPSPPADTLKTETFTFSSNGIEREGKIYLPDAYETNKSLPTIYLIDFTEQHFNIAKDEFEKVVAGVEQIEGFDALVVTLEAHLDIDSNPTDFQEYYDLFKNMTSYVDSNYTNDTSRTFIGRGSEAGLVLMALFQEDRETSVFDNFIATDSPDSFNSFVVNMINNGDFPQNKQNKKLHFSFSESNDYESCIDLINTINDAQYPWLQFKSIRYKDSDYENTYPISFADGIRYVFTE